MSDLLLPISVSKEARQKCEGYLEDGVLREKIYAAKQEMQLFNKDLSDFLLLTGYRRRFEQAVNANAENPLLSRGFFYLGCFSSYLAFGCDQPESLPKIPSGIIDQTREQYPATQSGTDWHFAVIANEELDRILQEVESSAPVTEACHNALYSGAGLVSLIVTNCAAAQN